MKYKIVRLMILMAAIANSGMSFATLEDDLIEAVKALDPNRVVSLLDQGADINYVVDANSVLGGKAHWATPLTLAILNKQTLLINELLVRGADVNKIGYLHLSPLMLAAFTDSTFLTKSLISWGAQVNAKSPDGRTALHLAARSYRRGNVETVRFLVEEAGANINATDENGRTPLWVAVEFENVEIVRYLLKKGAKLDNVLRKSDCHCHRFGGLRWGEEEGFTVLDFANRLLQSYQPGGIYHHRLESKKSMEQIVEYLAHPELVD